MGLRCLLGHDFTEPTTEREREERGEEVVVTIREVKECRRCGETQVITENTEVTSIGRHGEAEPGGVESGTGLFSGGADATGADVADATGTGGADDPGAVIDEAEASDADEGFDHPRGDPTDVDPSVEDDAEIIRDDPTDATPAESGPEPASGASSGEEAGERAAESAADVDSAERAHGEWPDADRSDAAGEDGGDESHGEWPDPDANVGTGRATSDEGVDSEGSAASEARSGVVSDEERDGADGTDPARSAADEDVEFIDADGSEGPGAWPEQDGEDEGFDAEVGDGTSDDDVTVDGNLTPRVNPDADLGDDVEFIEAESSHASARESRPSPGVSPTDERGESTGPAATSPTGPMGNGQSSGGSDRPAQTHEVELTTTAGDRAMEYLCPECGKREPVGASSMRAGDICPECKRGYIEERELE